VSPSSTLPGLRTTPDRASMRSVTVVLPASTWAKMPTLRMEDRRSTERRHIDDDDDDDDAGAASSTSASLSSESESSSSSSTTSTPPPTGTVEREAKEERRSLWR
jgi:hypothetical protein